MLYDENSGKVSLLIKTIGPGDEGEYTCTALNPYGEAICTVRDDWAQGCNDKSNIHHPLEEMSAQSPNWFILAGLHFTRSNETGEEEPVGPQTAQEQQQ